MAHPEGQLLSAGGSLVQESGETSRTRVCFMGPRCICMSVLVWVRSVLLKQVRSLSPLPADVHALPSRLRACGRISVWVLLNQKMLPPGNTHSVSRTRLVLAESETIWWKCGHLSLRPASPCGAVLLPVVTAWLLSLSLSQSGTNSRCLGKTVKVQAPSSAFPIYFPSFQQSESHKLPEAEMVSLV